MSKGGASNKISKSDSGASGGASRAEREKTKEQNEERTKKNEKQAEKPTQKQTRSTMDKQVEEHAEQIMWSLLADFLLCGAFLGRGSCPLRVAYTEPFKGSIGYIGERIII